MASLSVRDGDSGGVVLKCHAGCETENILSALALEWKDVCAEETVPYRAAAHSQLIESYVYEDAEGVPSYKVDRYHPKDFRQSHYELELDTWVPGLNGQQRLPFHLPELLAAKGNRAVFFVEGEKDVLTMERLGLVATTVAGGANAWKPELAEWFRGARKVVVLPDNDKPGHELATRVQGDLSKLNVDVQVLDLPDLPEKGDVSDWVARGGTREALEAIVKGSAPGGLRIYSGESLRAVPSPKSKFVIGACVQEGLTILCGAPKTGKSLIAIEMANAVARGSKALNYMHAEKGNALFFSLEDSLGMFRDRVGEMYGDFPEGLCVTRDKPGNILKNGWKNVELALKHIGNVRLVVVDTLACVHEGNNGKGSVYFQDADFGHAVHNWAAANGVGLILIHHDRKMKAEASGDPMDDISGSKGLTGAAVGIMMFRRQRFQDTGKLQVIGKTMADREYEVTRTATNRWVVYSEPDQEDAIRASVQKSLA